MSPFDILVIAHLTGDFLFQHNWMAANKVTKLLPLTVHSAVYTLTIAAFAAVSSVNLTPVGLILIFLSHLAIDRRTFPNWWVKKVMGVKEGQHSWLNIVVDQIFHLLILAFVL